MTKAEIATIRDTYIASLEEVGENYSLTSNTLDINGKCCLTILIQLY